MTKRSHSLDATKLASIQEELRVLKASISKFSQKEKRKSLKDLKGVWKGMNLTYEQIRDAEFKV